MNSINDLKFYIENSNHNYDLILKEKLAKVIEDDKKRVIQCFQLPNQPNFQTIKKQK